MDTTEWLKQLVALDTTSRNSNLELIHLVQDWYKSHHLSPKLIYDDKRTKANLFVTLPAHDGNCTNGGLVLSGHTDVVPVDGQDWDTNPFELSERHGCLYGRGTADMKGFIAVLLKLVPEFCQLKLAKPIHFVFSYDEEIGCLGIPSLLDNLKKWEIKPEGCVIGEPTNMQPVTANKGRLLFRCRIHGAAAHSSLTTLGCNAIEHAAQLISYLRNLANHYKEQGPFDKDFDVPFTSVSTNMVHGGSAYNIIPEWCEFVFEFRYLPHLNPQEITETIQHYIQKTLLPELHKEYPEATVELTKISGGGPGLDTSENEVITQLIRQVTQVKKKNKVAYTTEAGFYHRAKIPTVICGPGSIEQAHRANEFVTLEQLRECETIISKLVNHFVLTK
ncbi:acetylornithine deacetylase [Legionella micdadei]|uniref:Acetylornithine deacetylase n=1 Tax=Legionella micdadei TaxID=451 RepID=A0A098GGN5_LEGMI|nr:acetylornithine deacetylase [Legionella micdadei]ARG96950.1 acetylornithine deacetylase [Legionella micdadei]ARH00795.1 acetylornithine deacetylase [Legionella micdadei]KTD26660.1 acetylornithine deacetylase [Legionella micdadei]CEG61643.1 Acetylornithine deacetylase [Legionella micdadei]SCY47964.1 acetylornithine deacetylase [Legionella micdadei]